MSTRWVHGPLLKIECEEKSCGLCLYSVGSTAEGFRCDLFKVRIKEVKPLTGDTLRCDECLKAEVQC